MKKLLVALFASWITANTGGAAYAEQESACSCKDGVGVCVHIFGSCVCLCANDVSFKSLYKLFADAGMSPQQATLASNQVLTAMRSCPPGNSCGGEIQVGRPFIQEHISFTGRREAHS